VLVVSSAVEGTNPEVMEARKSGIPVIPRAEMLAELMRLKTSVAVAGSHGKTSTTSIIGVMLTQAGLDPTLVIGGRVNNLGLNARLGSGELLVAEADESDGSFLLLSPTITVVTNIDREHMNYYRDMEALREAFLAFINRVPFYGASILCLDDPGVQALIPRVNKRVVTYGLSAQAEITAKNIRAEGWGRSFDLARKGEIVARVSLGIPGRHNVLNALAAAAVGLELGLTPKEASEGIGAFKGVGRRFEHKGEAKGITVIDDYGHHPAEVAATLSALAERYPGRRKVVVFQPHRHTRTRDLFDRFVVSFNEADKLFLTDIYAAGETPFESITSETLAQAIIGHGHKGAEYLGPMDTLAERVLEKLKEGDVVMTLGAGSVYQAGERILKALEEMEGKGAKSTKNLKEEKKIKPLALGDKKTKPSPNQADKAEKAEEEKSEEKKAQERKTGKKKAQKKNTQEKNTQAKNTQEKNTQAKNTQAKANEEKKIGKKKAAKGEGRS
ncbi:MAG: UDP-N-acetylmuramate--L-alanine ligase, partial [Deltaproteobacteria bacterium]|jgi:UDP-N-acetylmuramate--alanine ligase|nr:UDP-N-acetylmuramate--L-alanine ligase [Deltaproteobacteria bacterium]